MNLTYVTQDEAHTQLYGWTSANFPQSWTAMASGYEVKGELRRVVVVVGGGSLSMSKENNRVTAAISQLDPVNYSTCPQKLQQHMHQAEGKKPDTLRVIKSKHQHSYAAWWLDPLDNQSPWWCAISSRMSSHTPASYPRSRLLFCSIIVYSLRIRAHVYTIKPLWWITTFFWTCKLPADQREGAVIMREIWHSRVGCALLYTAVNSMASSNKVVLLSVAVKPKLLLLSSFKKQMVVHELEKHLVSC